MFDVRRSNLPATDVYAEFQQQSSSHTSPAGTGNQYRHVADADRRHDLPQFDRTAIEPHKPTVGRGMTAFGFPHGISRARSLTPSVNGRSRLSSILDPSPASLSPARHQNQEAP